MPAAANSSAPDVAALYAEHDRHRGDRARLFGAVANVVGTVAVLYPGSYIDIAPSVWFDDVTYVDVDHRAARFFSQATAVADLVRGLRPATAGTPTLRFHQADYRTALPVADGSVGLLVSLYAGFVSEHCTRYLAPGGWLLANGSHGDVAMAALDPALALTAVVVRRAGAYRVRTDDLDHYLVPKRGHTPAAAELHRTRRGVAYVRRAHAYLFRNVDPADRRS